MSENGNPRSLQPQNPNSANTPQTQPSQSTEKNLNTPNPNQYQNEKAYSKSTPPEVDQTPGNRAALYSQKTERPVVTSTQAQPSQSSSTNNSDSE